MDLATVKAIASVCETAMLVCFGCSWPMNVIKAYKARTAKSTSLPFILLIITGYIFGIAKKVLRTEYDLAFYFYILNIIIVSLNVIVYFRNRALDRKANKQ